MELLHCESKNKENVKHTLVSYMVRDKKRFRMPSKIYANTTELPIYLNFTIETSGETNNNGFTIYHSTTAPEKIHISPGNINTDNH